MRQESGRSQRGWISERAGIIDVQTVAGLELAAVSSADDIKSEIAIARGRLRRANRKG